MNTQADKDNLMDFQYLSKRTESVKHSPTRPRFGWSLQHMADLVPLYLGKWVLIRENEVVWVADTRDGLRAYPSDPKETLAVKFPD